MDWKVFSLPFVSIVWTPYLLPSHKACHYMYDYMIETLALSFAQSYLNHDHDLFTVLRKILLAVLASVCIKKANRRIYLHENKKSQSEMLKLCNPHSIWLPACFNLIFVVVDLFLFVILFKEEITVLYLHSQ
jgi:hypothetical protein